MHVSQLARCRAHVHIGREPSFFFFFPPRHHCNGTTGVMNQSLPISLTWPPAREGSHTRSSRSLYTYSTAGPGRAGSKSTPVSRGGRRAVGGTVFFSTTAGGCVRCCLCVMVHLFFLLFFCAIFARHPRPVEATYSCIGRRCLAAHARTLEYIHRHAYYQTGCSDRNDTRGRWQPRAAQAYIQSTAVLFLPYQVAFADDDGERGERRRLGRRKRRYGKKGKGAPQTSPE